MLKIYLPGGKVQDINLILKVKEIVKDKFMEEYENQLINWNKIIKNRKRKFRIKKWNWKLKKKASL